MPRRREGADEGGGFPMAVRDADPQPLAPRAASVAARHVGRGPGLVDEHQALGIEVELTLEPGLALAQDVGAVLLAGVGGLFLRVMAWRLKKRCSVPKPNDRPWSRKGPAASPLWSGRGPGRARRGPLSLWASTRMGSAVATQGLRPGVALLALAGPPSADARSAHAEALARRPMRNTLGNRRQNPATKIERKRLAIPAGLQLRQTP